MARQHVAHLRFAGVQDTLQVVVAAHEDAGGAEAALQGVVALEGLLQVGHRSVRIAQAFDGVDAAGVDLQRQRQAGAAGHAVDLHGAGTAHAVLAAHVCAGRAQAFAQEVR